jgi:hypothetical protein
MKSFKEFIGEEGAVPGGPTNVTGPGINGMSAASEPGVNMKKKKKVIMMPLAQRKPPIN